MEREKLSKRRQQQENSIVWRQQIEERNAVEKSHLQSLKAEVAMDQWNIET